LLGITLSVSQQMQAACTPRSNVEDPGGVIKLVSAAWAGHNAYAIKNLTKIKGSPLP